MKKVNNLNQEADTLYFIPQDLWSVLYIIVLYEQFSKGTKEDYDKAIAELDKRKKQIGVITNVKKGVNEDESDGTNN